MTKLLDHACRASRRARSIDPGSTDLARAGSSEAARVAPSSLEEGLRDALGAKSRSRRSLEGPEEAIWDDLGGFWEDFRDFQSEFQGRSRLLRATCSTRSAKGRTSVFVAMRGVNRGPPIFRQNGNSTKFCEISLRVRFATEPI